MTDRYEQLAEIAYNAFMKDLGSSASHLKCWHLLGEDERSAWRAAAKATTLAIMYNLPKEPRFKSTPDGH